MGGRRETVVFDVGGEFFEGGDAFLLEAFVFLEEVAVGPGVAGDAFVVVAEDVVRKEELGIASAAGTEGHEEHGGFFGEVRGKLVRDEFNFGGVSARVFESFHLVVELGGFFGGFADGAKVGPGGVARDHAEMANDGNALARHSFNEVRAA